MTTNPTQHNALLHDQRLADHTLVIPTYNRPALLKQLVAYLADRARPMPLLVLDSSADDEAASENAKSVARHAAFARYVRFPSNVPMAAKLAAGLTSITTSTASFCADDDLIFVPALAQALHFLDSHPDYVSAHGLYFNFSEHGHDIHIMGEYAGRSIEAEHPGARLFQLMQSYESLFYGVFRTTDLHDILTNVAELPSLHYQELFQSSAALMLGKVARLPKFYAARRSGPAAEPMRDKWQTYYWFAESPGEFVEHYLAYREKLWDFYSAHVAEPPLTRADFDRILDICHAMYFSKACPPAYFHSVLQAYWPKDVFDEREHDIFAEHGGSHVTKPAGGLEVFLEHVQSWLASRRRFTPSADVRGALESLNSEVRAVGHTAWNCRIVSELGWLARDEDFRTCYRELCGYLNAAP